MPVTVHTLVLLRIANAITFLQRADRRIREFGIAAVPPKPEPGR